MSTPVRRTRRQVNRLQAAFRAGAHGRWPPRLALLQISSSRAVPDSSNARHLSPIGRTRWGVKGATLRQKTRRLLTATRFTRASQRQTRGILRIRPAQWPYRTDAGSRRTHVFEGSHASSRSRPPAPPGVFPGGKVVAAVEQYDGSRSCIRQPKRALERARLCQHVALPVAHFNAARRPRWPPGTRRTPRPTAPRRGSGARIGALPRAVRPGRSRWTR